MVMATHRIWPSTSGPSSAASDATPYSLGTEFYSTADVDLSGYWWWCPPGGSTASKTFQVWSVVTGTFGTAVPGTAAVSATLSPGSWNFTALTPAVPLQTGQRYRASATDLGGSNWYGATPSGLPSDIVNGPLVCPSTADATGGVQGSFTVGATPSFPQFSGGSNYWVDVEVTDSAPAPAPQTTARSRLRGREPVQALSGRAPSGKISGREPVSSVRGGEP